MRRGPQALTAVMAAIAATWRFSSYIVRASKQAEKAMRNEDCKNQVFLSRGLIGHHGINLREPSPCGVGFLLRGAKGSLGDTKANLELTVLPGQLNVAVFGRSPWR